MTDETFDLDVDPMLFMQTVVDDGLEFLATLDDGPPEPILGMFGVPSEISALIGGVADVQREKVDEAQGYLDQMIAEDTSWRPCYGTWCEMVPDGTDTDGSEWNRCTVHGYLVLGDAYVCEGYAPPPYVEGKGRA